LSNVNPNIFECIQAGRHIAADKIGDACEPWLSERHMMLELEAAAAIWQKIVPKKEFISFTSGDTNIIRPQQHTPC
jgi:hypothetical protein